jgi:hypothetical protein
MKNVFSFGLHGDSKWIIAAWNVTLGTEADHKYAYTVCMEFRVPKIRTVDFMCSTRNSSISCSHKYYDT